MNTIIIAILSFIAGGIFGVFLFALICCTHNLDE